MGVFKDGLAQALKALFKGKHQKLSSFEQINDLQKDNIIGYQTKGSVKKLVVRRVHLKAGKELVVLNHSYKKEIIKDDGSHIIKLVLEPAHLLNLKFKKDAGSDIYHKAGITILCVNEHQDKPEFFVTKDDVQLSLPYIHSLQNYCNLIKHKELDFGLLL